jgi:sugar O-acyltransferase (sialic acid O-acetyltransferase NeuD family)
MPPLFFLGDGGYSQEVALIARLIDPHRERWNEYVFLGAADEEAALNAGGDVALAIGNPTRRLQLWQKYRPRTDLNWPILIHPRADLGPNVSVGAGSCIGSGTIVTTNVTIGEAVLLNIAVTVGHDCRIGAGSVVNPGVAVSGGVVMGAGCLLGAGAVVLENLELGAGATVGAGAVVTKPVAAGTTVVGIPARVLNPTPAQA